MDYQKLINKARDAMTNTYSPYSNFAVGAALEVQGGEIYLGTNIENASFGATICAERSAIFSAISQGEVPKNFKTLAIISNMNNYTYPCSMCRQVMVEFFGRDVKILMINKNLEYKEVNIDDLVPYKFTKKELKNV